MLCHTIKYCSVVYYLQRKFLACVCIHIHDVSHARVQGCEVFAAKPAHFYVFELLHTQLRASHSAKQIKYITVTRDILKEGVFCSCKFFSFVFWDKENLFLCNLMHYFI